MDTFLWGLTFHPQNNHVNCSYSDTVTLIFGEQCNRKQEKKEKQRVLRVRIDLRRSFYVSKEEILYSRRITDKKQPHTRTNSITNQQWQRKTKITRAFHTFSHTKQRDVSSLNSRLNDLGPSI